MRLVILIQGSFNCFDFIFMDECKDFTGYREFETKMRIKGASMESILSFQFNLIGIPFPPFFLSFFFFLKKKTFKPFLFLECV